MYPTTDDVFPHLGMVTNRDIDFVEDPETPLKDIMSTNLIKATEPVTLTEANTILRDSKKGKLPVVDADGGFAIPFSEASSVVTCSLVTCSLVVTHRLYRSSS